MTITVSTGGLTNCWEEPNGFAHSRSAPAMSAAVLSAKTAPTNHAAGRHRPERSRPVGKSRNKKATRAREIDQIHVDTQRANGPAGQDPGAATSACCQYRSAKVRNPSVRLAASASQPIGFPGPPRGEDETDHRDGHVDHVLEDIGDVPAGHVGRH